MVLLSTLHGAAEVKLPTLKINQKYTKVFELMTCEESRENTMAGVEYRMPSPLNMDNIDELYPQWKRFQSGFKIFVTAAGLGKVTETRKAAIFLNCIGQAAQELYFNTLQPKHNEEHKLEEVILIFEEYFKPKTNEIINTFHFNQRFQEDGENFDVFYTELRKIALNCNFETFLERMLRDRIIHGIKDRSVQQKLLGKKNLTLEQAVDICRTSELSKEHVKTINQPQMSAPEVDAVQVKKFQGAQQETSKDKYSQINSSYTYLCKKCNRRHGPRKCPAFGKTCSLCNKINHFAVGCRRRNEVNSVNVDGDCDNESPVDL